MSASAQIQQVVGFDRVAICFDIVDPKLPLQALCDLCRDVQFRIGQEQFGARWKSRLELFQPQPEALVLLAGSLPPIASAKVVYAEIAFDALCPSAKVARRLLRVFLGAARMRSQRQPVVRSGTVFYYGRRATSSNSRRQGPVRRRHVMVAYADRPSKLRNLVSKKPALHIEWRASGSGALADLGLVTVADLVSFDHWDFWERNVVMYELPRRTDLGRLLARCARADISVSGAALRKRAASWERASMHGDVFIMQNALLGRPAVAKGLIRHPWASWWSVVGQHASS